MVIFHGYVSHNQMVIYLMVLSMSACKIIGLPVIPFKTDGSLQKLSSSG
jgi:hypothetical protein